MSIFIGAGIALITPMDKYGAIDYDSMEQIIENQIAEGTDAIIVCGTTGEASTMSHDEHIETIRTCVSIVNHRIPVIAGTGSNCTETAVHLSKEAYKSGVDGLLVVTPYYNKGTQKGMKKHFETIARAVDLPMILYNIPGRTGVNLKPETIASLVKEVPQIVGVKEASGDLSQVATLFSLTDGDIDVYSGNDDQIVPVVALGGKGVISVLSHVAPKDTHDMVMTLLNGDVDTSQRLQRKYIPLIHALFSEVNPIPVKAAMNMMGYSVGTPRLPLTEMEPEHKLLLRKALEEAGIRVTMK